MMIKAVLIDDELHSSKLLEIKLKNIAMDIQILDIIHTPADALERLAALAPDVIFLDIDMPLMDGFSLLRQLGDIPFEVIFVTAYDQHGINAIKMSALDYILKPVDDDELSTAISKLRLKLSEKKANQMVPQEQMGILFETLQRSQNNSGRLALSTQDGVLFVRFKDILKVESSSNYSIFHLLNRQKIMVSRTLKEYEDVLEEYQFLRVNRSCIVNLDEVIRYRKGDGGTLELTNQTEVEVSPQKKADLLQRMGIG